VFDITYAWTYYSLTISNGDPLDILAILTVFLLLIQQILSGCAITASRDIYNEDARLIVDTDVVSESTDHKQIARQINQANDTFEKKCSVVCADAG
jgi:hypothetical protein